MLAAAGEVVDQLAEVLGDRLVGAAVYGSAVTGDVLPGRSDLDLGLVLGDEPGLAEVHRAHLALRGVDLGGAAYLQLHAHAIGGREPWLVPGSYRWLRGEPPPGVELDADRLVTSGADWLSRLPAILAGDGLDWVAAGDRTPRQLRLLLTRLKPAVRAVLVGYGEPAVLTWAAGWPVLAERWSRHDVEAAALLRRLLADLHRPDVDEDEAGRHVLTLLHRIAAV